VIGGKYVEMFALGIRNLWGYKLRSFLTTLGISFGIAAVIGMLGTGEGAQRAIMSQIGRLGIRNIIINSRKPSEDEAGSTGGATSMISSYGLTFKDYRQIEATVPTAITVLPVHDFTSPVWEGSRRVDAKVHGVVPEHMSLLNLSVTSGRNLSAVDNLQLNRVCVVRPGLLKALQFFGDAIGHRLQLGNQYYEIVGVLAEEEFTSLTMKALQVDSRNLEIYAPYETVIKRHGTFSSIRKAGSWTAEDVDLHQIVVEVDKEDNVLPTARMLEMILAKFHRERDYELIVPLELLAQQKRAQRTFNIFMIFIATISLIVGGIGIVNIMLATITERTREIGIRRAIGAKQRHIVAQFLTETVTLAAAGGVLGLALGIAFLPLLESLTSWTAVVPPGAIVLAIGISCAVGVLAGLWPAFRAAKMDPIAALRYE
jgi:putative ABC transport system permease protein